MAARKAHTIARQAALREVAVGKLRSTAGTHCRIDGFRLIDVTVDGQLVTHCEGCARRKDHQCLDCWRPTTGRAWRCPTHHAARLHQQQTEHVARTREERNARQAARARKAREQRSAYNRRWRAENPIKEMLQRRRERVNREARRKSLTTSNTSRKAA